MASDPMETDTPAALEATEQQQPSEPTDNDNNNLNHAEDDQNLAAAATAAAAAATTSDSDSDDEDDDAENALQLQSFESELSLNPSNYDAHVQYISLLRKMGEVEKLRRAREAMREMFPMTPSMWQQWAKDEITMNSGPEAVSAIEKLYECGISDYLSVPLWCDYLNFVQEYDPSISICSADGVSKARDLFERALTAAGLHFTEGSKVWEAYREFEQAICLLIEGSNVEAKEKQIQRVRSIFHRQLSVPLADMSSTLNAYKVWEMEQGNDLDVNSSDLKGIPSPVASKYKDALVMYTARINLEEQIAKAEVPDSERLALFKKYLKFEESAKDPARVQILYERAITEFPVASDLWLDYTSYLNKTLKVGNTLRGVFIRATRNCPWIGELWARYMLFLERARASDEEVSLVFEKALLCTFSSYEEYLDLYLTRVDGLRRRISTAAEMHVLDYAVIRDAFQRASDFLSQHLKGTDALLRLHAYWARLELSLAKDIAAAREVWESLLKISGTMLDGWLGYISMEIENGNLNEARSLYRRSYTKKFPGSGSEEVCQCWLRFEREFGTLEDYDFAVQKVSPRLEELYRYRLQESINVAGSGEPKEHSSKKSVREKRKPSSNLSEDQSPSKRQKEMKRPYKKETNKDHDKPQNVQVAKKTEKSIANVDKVDNSRELKNFSHEKPKYSDQCTAFVSNLCLNANYEDLRNFFSDVGGVQSIRILKDRYTGKSRGLAYVDFCDDAHLDAAVAKNKKTMLGKKISIARSDPSKSKKQSSGARHEEDREGAGKAAERSARKDSAEPSESADQRPSAKRPAKDEIQLRGKSMFAIPRSVRVSNKPKSSEVNEEKPKSNEELREMLLKK